MIWLGCALYYVLSIGALGVTSSLALRNLHWPDLILWNGVGYAFVVAFMLFTRKSTATVKLGSWWAILSAALAISGLVALYLGLAHGSAAQVVTVGAGYPAVTVLLAAMFLSESLTVARVAGVLLVIAGCVLISLF